MTDLRTLYDAFEELERRADTVSAAEHAAAPATGDAVRLSPAGPRPERPRWAAPLVAAVALLVVAGGGTAWWRVSSDQPSRTPAGAGQLSASQATPSSNAPSRAATPATYVPPHTAAELTAKARAILGGLASITVTDTGTNLAASTPPSATPANSSAASRTRPASPVTIGPGPIIIGSSPTGGGYYDGGSAIVGIMTAADGTRGGFDLDLWSALPAGPSACDEGEHCTTSTEPDGSSLSVGTWRDPSVAGGLTWSVNYVRPDGASFAVHISNEASPKGESKVLAPRPPLTLTQLIAFVRSDLW